MQSGGQTGHPLYIVDAFTRRPFGGNPAAVCVLEDRGEWPAAVWMQQVAAEMNLSETAFLRPGTDPSDWGLRWFTPAAEVELCGHATLAAAHVLWRERGCTVDVLHFQTVHSGTLSCRRGEAGGVVMDFPAQHAAPEEAPAGLLDALGVDPARVRGASFGPYDWIVELDGAAAVRDLTPDFNALARFNCRGVAVTARAEDDAEADIVSRFFAPRHRIAEDPVTGSLHCVLMPLWAERLGCDTLVAEQASARGGVLRLSMHGDRVHLAGDAVTVLSGNLAAASD